MAAIVEPSGAAADSESVLAALIDRLANLLDQRACHAARTLVLLPYAQLMPLARRAWARHAPDGFTPRFETTLNWAARSGFAPGPEDLSFERGLDLLTARVWLERAGLGRSAAALAPALVDAAWQAAGPAAAVVPAQREVWAEQARTAAGLGLDDPVLAMEAALARIAIAWAAASAYASDPLLTPQTWQSIDLLVVWQGLQPDPLTQTLLAQAGEKAVCWSIDDPSSQGQVALHACADPSQEAEQAAACVMRHLAAGLAPVALAAVDRVLTRRVRAMLAARGVSLSDETGWKLSTTRAAAHVMSLLKACAWDAGSDEVLDWLKNTPVVPASVSHALEERVRRSGLRVWSSVRAARLMRLSQAGAAPPDWAPLIEQAQAWREQLAAARPLPLWQQAVREWLQTAGQWDPLVADAAGMQLIAALGLDEAGQGLWAQFPQAARRLSLSEFTGWVQETLEAESFVPDSPQAAQVVVLPFNQLLGRRFAALVIPGCDEISLMPSPEPVGAWTPGQRLALGLPAREELEQVVRAGWRHALQTPQVDVLWRQADDAGEPLLSSPLVQQLVLEGQAHSGADARQSRPLLPQPVARPEARAPQLPVLRLSASAYEDLRKCPYRFFALRQLGLQEAEEIDTDLDKRDFGNWVHEVLRRFHEFMRDQGVPAAADRAAVMDRLAQDVTRSMALPPDEFLPFEAAWPQVRRGYLEALLQFEKHHGAVFVSAETDHEVDLQGIGLRGRIDRIDRLPDGRRMVMDYKTESATTTKDRIKQPLEDTQLAFYAALLQDPESAQDDTLRASYVNVGERGETLFLEQAQVVQARDALIEGVIDDLQRIGAGAVLPALGEGQACDFCAARGLCRKDFWHA